MSQFNFKIDEELRQRLKVKAYTNNETMGSYLVKCLDNSLNNEEFFNNDEKEKQEVKPEVFADAVLKNAYAMSNEGNHQYILNWFNKYFKEAIIKTLAEL